MYFRAMVYRRITGFLILLLHAFPMEGWAQKKELQMQRTSAPPVVDGSLSDECWKQAPMARDFVMLNPGNGPAERAQLRTDVKLLFDDNYLYVAARLFDQHPDSILTELTPRDDFSRNNDWFGIFINPYNDGLSDFNFWVTAAGVQADSRTTADGDDFGWNTVWFSEVVIDSLGWTVEMAIPYQSLRFAEDGPSTWGLNMIRYIRRIREEYSWNFIDKSFGTYEQQCGLMHGMEGIEPPVRLSFLPYASAYMNDYKGQTDWSYRLGLDLKYGINESFTLDATLVPDFGQVPFDNQQLNLSPFELQFEENRPFFNEGVDLFNKGGLFYSRRIGGAPNNVTNAQASDTSLQPSLPEFTQLINAIKVSGRTGKNLGIGVFNAITADNFQTFNNPETGQQEEVLIEPLTNYNILVLDQRFNRNSSVSLINTSTIRSGAAQDANVTGLLADLRNKNNSWRLNQEFILSQLYFSDSASYGYKMTNRIDRTKGRFQYGFGQEIMSEAYDINDLGFQPRANLFNHYAHGVYQIFQPAGAFNRYRFTLYTNYEMLYSPRVFTDYYLGGSFFFLTKNFFAFGGGWDSNPIGSHDYFETRTVGRYWERPARDYFNLWISSDYRKAFALDMRYISGFWHGYDYTYHRLSVEPRYRFNDHLTLSFEVFEEWVSGDIGWASSEGGEPIFGRRNLQNTRFDLRGSYVLNEKSSLTLNLRYLWSTVDYNSFYALVGSELAPIDRLDDLDLNFNSWNLDLRYSWWFAPASELVLLYRNALLNLDDQIGQSLGDNVQGLFALPQANNLSIRFTYFLDYNAVFRQSRNPSS